MFKIGSRLGESQCDYSHPNALFKLFSVSEYGQRIDKQDSNVYVFKYK